MAKRKIMIINGKLTPFHLLQPMAEGDPTSPYIALIYGVWGLE